MAGVAGGLAERTGVDANVIRVAFALVSVGGGLGLAAYAIAWMFVPRQGTDVSVGRRSLADRASVRLALGVATLAVAALLALAAFHLGFAAGLVWPVAVVAIGAVLVWRGADPDEKAFLRDLLDQAPLVGSPQQRSRRSTVARVVAGTVLVLVGLASLAGTRHLGGAAVRGIVAANIAILGFFVIFGPWWLQLARDLSLERRERVRTEERANVAAAVHDSVLQTLALIQRAADDPREVTRLARAQERELRAWLFEGRPPGTFDAASVTTVGEAVAVIEQEVEAAHRVPVDAVVVGDCPLTDDLRALLAAGREALVNAAKWSGAPSASLFVEVEATRVSVFVRDRGVGFDPGAVDGDRRGLTESVRGRMARHGGSVVIRSSPGDGTEVELIMPRAEAR